jgi:hypothetical protein
MPGSESQAISFYRVKKPFSAARPEAAAVLFLETALIPINKHNAAIPGRD